MKKAFKENLGVAFTLALPLLDFILVLYLVYIASVPDLLSPFVAIPVGCVIGAIALGMLVVSQGNTGVEINIGAFMLFVMILIAYPVARRVAVSRRAHLHSHALKAQEERIH